MGNGDRRIRQFNQSPSDRGRQESRENTESSSRRSRSSSREDFVVRAIQAREREQSQERSGAVQSHQEAEHNQGMQEQMQRGLLWQLAQLPTDPRQLEQLEHNLNRDLRELQDEREWDHIIEQMEPRQLQLLEQSDDLASNQNGPPAAERSLTKEQLFQQLGNLFQDGYQNITPRQQLILDSAMAVSTEMTAELNIQTAGFGDERSVIMGDLLQGAARRGRNASVTEDVRESPLYQELKESFLTRLKDKMIQTHEEEIPSSQQPDGVMHEVTSRERNSVVEESVGSVSQEQARLDLRRSLQLSQILDTFGNGETYDVNALAVLDTTVISTNDYLLRNVLEMMRPEQLSQIATNVRRTFFNINQPRITSGVRILEMIGSIRQQRQEEEVVNRLLENPDSIIEQMRRANEES